MVQERHAIERLDDRRSGATKGDVTHAMALLRLRRSELLSKRLRLSGEEFVARKTGLSSRFECRMQYGQRLAGRPVLGGDDGDRIAQSDDMLDAGDRERRRAIDGAEPATVDRRGGQCRVAHPGQAHVDAVLHLAGDLRRDVRPGR